MKKIFLGFALAVATLSFAQQYPNGNWGNGGNNNGYYGDQDGQDYFPDDYYYDYPQDYYPQDYYQSYYNDYRNSIVNVNWNSFFRQNRLNRWQVEQILYLNNLYADFANWNSFYQYNPDRWYYDRFYAMERILGPRIFVVYQNNYFQGRPPVVYFQNYRKSYYSPRFRVTPRYRNVNINIYKVDRNNFRGNNNPTLNVVRNNGFRNGSTTTNGGFRDGNSGTRNNSGGFRNSESPVRNNGGNSGTRSENSGGFRNNSGSRPAESTPRTETPREGNGGIRNGGLRNPQPKNENAQPRIQNSPSRQKSGGEGRSNGGFRNGLVKN